MNDIKIEISSEKVIYYRKLGEKLYADNYIIESQGKYGLINSSFHWIVLPYFEKIKPAFKNHFWGQTKDYWHLYDFKMKKVSELSFKDVDTFQLDFSNVSIDGKSYGFIDKNCNIILDPIYGKGIHLGLNYFLISQNKSFAVIDNNKNFIIPFQV